MSAKESKRSRKSWCDSSEIILLDLWADKIGELNAARRNGHIYDEMAAQMLAYGYNFTGDEIKVKIHNLSNRYRKEKILMGPSGGSPSKWKHFDALQQILGRRKSYNATDYVEDSILVDLDVTTATGDADVTLTEDRLDQTLTEEMFDENSTAATIQYGDEVEPRLNSRASSTNSLSSSSSSTKKKTKSTAISLLQDMSEQFSKVCQVLTTTEEQKLKIMESQEERNIVMQEALVDYLRRH